MNDDDDATVLQTEEDREKIREDLLSGRYDPDNDDDTTLNNLELVSE